MTKDQTIIALKAQLEALQRKNDDLREGLADCRAKVTWANECDGSERDDRTHYVVGFVKGTADRLLGRAS